MSEKKSLKKLSKLDKIKNSLKSLFGYKEGKKFFN